MCSRHILVANISSLDLLVACRQLKWRCRLTGWTEHISTARDAMSELLCSTSESIVCQVLYAQYPIYRATGSTDFAATISSACKTVFPRDAMLMPLLVMPQCLSVAAVCVRPSVRLSQVGVLSKRMNRSSWFWFCIGLPSTCLTPW